VSSLDLRRLVLFRGELSQDFGGLNPDDLAVAHGGDRVACPRVSKNRGPNPALDRCFSKTRMRG